MNPNYPDNRPIYKRTPTGNIYKDGGRLQQLIDNIERLKLLIIKEKERYAKCPLSCYHEMSETPGYQFQWTDFENGKKFKCKKCVSDDDGNSAVDPVDPTRLVVVGEDDKGNLIKERVAVFRQPATEKKCSANFIKDTLLKRGNLNIKSYNKVMNMLQTKNILKDTDKNT